jgi:AhpD family alkylhydroperoxidase
MMTRRRNMADRMTEFREQRERMNEAILKKGNLGINRFFALDTRTYEAGALDVRTKELLGLAASTVLRCDDCITYHLIKSVEEGISDEEILEALDIALVVGGSIVIPHLRRAVEMLDMLRKKD